MPLEAELQVLWGEVLLGRLLEVDESGIDTLYGKDYGKHENVPYCLCGPEAQKK